MSYCKCFKYVIYFQIKTSHIKNINQKQDLFKSSNPVTPFTHKAGFNTKSVYSKIETFTLCLLSQKGLFVVKVHLFSCF